VVGMCCYYGCCLWTSLSEYLLSYRTRLSAYPAVVASVKFEKMGFLVAVAGPGIQYNIPFHARAPAAPLQRFCRAGFNAFGAFAARTFFNGRCRYKRGVGEHCAQAHPGAPGSGQKPAVFPHPARPGWRQSCAENRRGYSPDRCGWKRAWRAYASERYWMFVDTTVDGMQVIQHRASRIQHRPFNGYYIR
jgi:hypothetical protein